MKWRKIESGEYKQQLLSGQCESFFPICQSAIEIPSTSGTQRLLFVEREDVLAL
jgi:hypothetical protein